MTLQRVLGHATLATMKYAHFSPGHMAEVVNLNTIAKTVEQRKSKER